MKKNSHAIHRGLLLALSAGSVTVAGLACSAALSACGGDDDFVPPPPDASADSSTTADATPDQTSPVTDAAADHAVGPTDAALDSADVAPNPADAAAPAHVLVVSGSTNSVLASVALDGGAIEGTTSFSGGFGAPTTSGGQPFLMEQAVSVVARLDSVSPWKIDSTWNVNGTDEMDGGYAYSDPDGVVVPAGNKAYVLRYTRNQIDIIDPSQTVDGGGATGSIDLSSLVQVGDSDGVVEMTNGFYDATTKRLWVVLENIDRNTFGCIAAKATLIAVDTLHDTLVSLGGSGPGGAYAFSLVDPEGVVFDSANDRVLVAANGCQAEQPIDGGPGVDAGSLPGGPLVGAGIEAISLSTGASTVLIPASAVGTGTLGGTSLVLVGGTDAVATFTDPLTYEVSGYLVDLGARTVKSTLLLNSSEIASDGKGHVYALSYAADGGANQDLVVIDVADGTNTVLAASVVTDPEAFVGGVALW